MPRRAWRIWVGVGVGLAVAAGCSSSNSDPLAGKGSDGGGGSGYCPTDTSASAGKGYAANPAGDNSAQGCTSCHTADMGGTSTPLAQFPAPNFLYPPNLTPDTTTGVGNWRDSDLTAAIRDGVDNQSERLCPQMQHYPGMCDSELNGIIAWLHSIPAVVRKIPRSVCPPLKPAPVSSSSGGDGG